MIVWLRNKTSTCLLLIRCLLFTKIKLFRNSLGLEKYIGFGALHIILWIPENLS